MTTRGLWKAFPVCLAACLAVLGGCSALPSAYPEAAASFDDVGAGLVDLGSRGLHKSTAAESARLSSDPAAERLLIQRADLRLAVSSPDETGKAATKIARELGGYAQSTSNESVVLRIPAPRFDEALDRLSKIGRVLARNVTAQDVTEEVVDLRLRLKNALALRDRLAQLLEKADKIEDVLKIEAELTRLRTEVERLEGRLKLLETDVALSLVTLNLVQLREAPRGKGLPFSWLHELGLERLLGGR